MRTLALHIACLHELERDARYRRYVNAALFAFRLLFLR
jgi:hypothetical protein